MTFTILGHVLKQVVGGQVLVNVTRYSKVNNWQ